MLKQINRIKKIIIPCWENNYRPFVLDGRFLSYLALILILLKFIILFHLIIIPRTSYFADIVSGLLVKMTNEERQITGLSPLRINSQLTRAAELKAKDMIANNYFSHWSPQGKSPWYWIEIAGYNYEYAGENLAMGYLDTKEVHEAWIESSSHKQNIMNPNYREIGIAIIEDSQSGRSTFYVVQIFGTSRFETTYAVSTEKPVEKIIEELQEEPKAPVLEIIENQELILKPILDPILDLINDNHQKETQQQEEIIETHKDNDVTEEETEEENEKNSYFSVLGEYDTGVYLYSARPIIIDNYSLNLFEFLLIEYDDLIQKITTIILLFLGFVLIVNVFVRFDIQHPDLIFKGLTFLALFVIFDYLDQSTIIRIFFEAPIIN